MLKIDEKLQALLLQQEIEQFYYYEAALFDDRKFNEWLELLSDDLEYWMPIRTTRAWKDMDLEFAKLGEHAYFDDDKNLIVSRVKKLYTGCSWGEDPPSRTRHLVSNIRIVNKISDNEIDVSSNFNVFQSRLSDEENYWFGRREDRLRKKDNHWLVVRRHIFLDHVRLPAKSLTVFF
jgi:3-phenylpropionate/cinnamic acid dioxygenase small subunit